MKIRLSNEELDLINLFEIVTDVDCLDCYIDKENDTVFFVVPENSLSKAIGKDGRNVKFLEGKIGKNVRIKEFNPKIEKFINNLISYVKDIKVNNNGKGNVVEVTVEKHAKPYVLGRNRRNLKIYKRLISKNFDIQDLIIK